MVEAQKRAGDPNAGRVVVIAAGAVALAGLLGYAVMQSNQRSQAKAAAQQVRAEPRAQPGSVAIPDLITRARQARQGLDTATLQQVETELAEAARATTSAPKALDAQRERLAVLGTLAVESAVRSAALGDPEAAKQATDHVNAADALLGEIGPQLDPGLRSIARARIAFASGDDVATRHPMVLLPAFRDRELRHVVLTEPLWRPDDELPMAEDARTELTRALEEAPDASALERLLLGLAIEAAGDTQRAGSLYGDVLTSAPDQPLAMGLRQRLHRGTQVAVAGPAPVGVGTPAVSPEPEPIEPEPAPEPEPEPVETKPEPVEAKPEPKPKPKPKPEPEPVEAKPEPQPQPEPEPAPAPAGDKPKPKPKPSGSGGSKKKTPAELTADGCQEVRSGDAKKGFAMLQKAFDLNPRDNKVTLCMAEGHMKLGRLPSARAMAERVLRSSPKNKKALLLAAKIENKMGNKRSAVDYYRQVLEIDPENSTAKSFVDKNG